MASFPVDLFILLLAAHVAGDFVLQTNEDVARKREPLVLARHSLIHAVLVYTMSGLWHVVWLPVVIGVAHGVIDWVKSRFGSDRLAWFFGDQAAHLVTIAAAAVVATMLHGEPAWSTLGMDAVYPILLVLSGAVLTIRVGGIVVGMTLVPYLDELIERAGADALPDARGFGDGGRVIGYLERTLLYILVLTGNLTAVGFLVAAKAFFRIGEIRDQSNRLEAEYIIIGTLASFAYGVIVANGIALLLGVR